MSRKPLVVCTTSFAVVLFALAGVVTAEQGRSIEQTDISKLADQAVKIMDVSEVTMQEIYATIEGMLKQMAETMISQGTPTELAEKMEKSLKISTLKKEINFDAIEDKLKRRYNSIFSNTYTEEELQALISFYQSPMGKQIIKKQPNLVKLMFPIQGEMLNEIMPKVDQMIMEEMSNLVLGQSGLTELEVKILSQEKDHSVEISLHPDETFNGVYKVQAELINERPWYKNNSDRYLYFYDQAEGGEKSWSLDHRKPDGNKDWFSGGFTSPTGGTHPEPGIYPWQAVSGSPNDDFMPVDSDISPNSDTGETDFVGEYTYRLTLPGGAIETGEVVVKRKKSIYYIKWTRDDGPIYFGIGIKTGNLMSVCYSYSISDSGERGVTVYTLSSEQKISGRWTYMGGA